jgi:N-methylhydantoinase A
MGGTTAKLCVLAGGRAARSRTFEAGRVHRFIHGSGMPVIVPVYDLVEIGAGGGSIARIDNLGLVSVGPQSAGAQPGPACYGRGGTEPTVTDADLVMGHLAADAFLGGGMGLDLGAARTAIGTQVAEPLGLTVEEAAHGICETVNEAMASAARLHIAEKGSDPARLTVIAFGGAGPSHAVELARKLGCPKVLYPVHAGVMSSFGLLTAPPAFERMASVRMLAADCSPAALAPVLDRLRTEISRTMDWPEAEVQFRFIAEMWHKGQEYPIEVDFVQEEVSEGLAAKLAERFRARYAALYGRTDDELPLEVSVVRAIGTVAQEAITGFTPKLESRGLTAGMRKVYDQKAGRLRDVPVHPRPALAAGAVIQGPAVIQDLDSATVIRAGDTARVLDSLAIEITLGNGNSGEGA